jgi:hypothetical protein
MSARELEQLLLDLLVEAADDNDPRLAELHGVVRFDEAGLLTRDRGVVVEFDHSEFQVTIVQSAYPDGDDQ